MAIKISGNTVIDDSQNITATGSATFAGDTNIGAYNGGSTTTDGVLLGAGGGVYSQLAAATASSGVVWQGMHGSSFTSRITADGNATFAGGLFNIAANGGLQMGSAGTANGVTLSMIAGTSPAASAYTLLQCYQSDGTTQAFAVKADGSAEFAGGNLTITSTGRLDTSEINSIGTAGFYAKSPSDSGYGLRVVDSSNTHVFDINFQGNVMARRNLNLTNGYGAGTDGNAALFTRNAANDTTTSKINYDGSAEFAGTITSGESSPTTDTGSWMQEFGGVYTTRPAGSTDSAFAAYQEGSSTPTVNIKADGTATFTGTITAAGYSLSNLTELT